MSTQELHFPELSVSGVRADKASELGAQEPLRLSEDALDMLLLAMTRDELVAFIQRGRELVRHQDARFASMLAIGSALGTTLQIDDLLQIIVERTTEMMEAERSSMFLVDDRTGDLWSKVVQGGVNIEIRLQRGQGIAGWVAMTGKSLNIRDAYQDKRFNPKVDETTGYVTRNILCQPIRNVQGDIIGVIQVLNRVQGNFTDEDENLLSAIASQAAVAIENSKLFLSAVEQNMELIEFKDRLEHKVAELDMLYELERLISRAPTTDQLIEGVFQKMLELVHASSAVLTLQGGARRVYTMQDRGEWQPAWRFEERGGEQISPLAEEVCRTRRALLYCRAASAPGVLAQQVSQAGGLYAIVVENAIAVPLLTEDDCLGALELFNTVDPDERGDAAFGDDDRKIVMLVASQLAATFLARRRREEEEKENRLAAIGQMLSGVLHDFKNPMAVISGYVQLMARNNDPGQRAEFAATILKQFEQLNQMTREVLTFARGDKGILLRKVFVHKFMEELGELLEPELTPRNVQLELELEYRQEAKLDPVKIKRAILNLARNAADSMPQGGVFRVRVSRDEARDELVIACSDTGAGIPIEIRDRLFESFVTQGKKDGTGLGLAIVKKVVEDHEGTIAFETSAGVGTTFTIRLPMRGAQ
jgi:signal transduction histidine kinase/putative methionine-R-sulfoxide reductase with GAF domain